MSHLRRREFVGVLGSAAFWPLTAHTQQPTKQPIIGFLGTGTQSAWSRWTSAFIKLLGELGWIETRTIAVEFRWAEGREERYSDLVADLIRQRVDVLVVGGGAVAAARQATSTVPIVFALASDPLGSGLVASLARPGGNVTGLSTQAIDLAGKQLEMLREVLPACRRLGIIANLAYRAAGMQMDELQITARKLSLEAVPYGIRRAEDIAVAFRALKTNVDAIFVSADPLVNSHRDRISALALTAHLPTMFGLREYVEAGGMMSYGPSIADLFRRTAEIVDKILRGANPADIPVEQPTKFEFVINLKTARALGLEIPATLLARADEVIE
jgi:putative ABC transport system substrate-binding protein